jgi:hypothetical protein
MAGAKRKRNRNYEPKHCLYCGKLYKLHLLRHVKKEHSGSMDPMWGVKMTDH